MADWSKGFQSGLMGTMRDPMFQLGMGLLSRQNQNIGGAMGGAMNDMSRAQAYQQAQVRMQQEQARKQQEQQWMDSQGMGNMPSWAAQEQWKAQNAAPKAPTLKMVMGPNGKPMWMTAANALGREAYARPQVEINTGGAKPSDKFTWKDPSDPSKGVRPVTGGAADPLQSDKYREGVAGYGRLQRSYDAYRELLERSGTELLPNEDKDKLKTAYNDFTIELKELYDLGALSGPDMGLIQGVATDPTSIGANIRGTTDYMGNLIGGGGNTSIGSSLNILGEKIRAAREDFNKGYGVGELNADEKAELAALRAKQRPNR